MADMFIRSFNAQTRDSIKKSARMRGMTLAQYLTALHHLHQDLLKGQTREQALNLNNLGTPREI